MAFDCQRFSHNFLTFSHFSHFLSLFIIFYHFKTFFTTLVVIIYIFKILAKLILANLGTKIDVPRCAPIIQLYKIHSHHDCYKMKCVNLRIWPWTAFCYKMKLGFTGGLQNRGSPPKESRINRFVSAKIISTKSTQSNLWRPRGRLAPVMPARSFLTVRVIWRNNTVSISPGWLIMPAPPGCPHICFVSTCGETVMPPEWDPKRHCYGILAFQMHMAKRFKKGLGGCVF